MRAYSEVTEGQGQAVTRIVLAAIGTLLLCAGRGFGHGGNPFLLALAQTLASFFYPSYVSRYGSGHLWRRHVVILLDLVVASFLTAHFGDAGIAFYPLFLRVMIGKAIRYGQYHIPVRPARFQRGDRQQRIAVGRTGYSHSPDAEVFHGDGRAPGRGQHPAHGGVGEGRACRRRSAETGLTPDRRDLGHA